MQAWHFSETAYPYLPPVETYSSIRVTLPNRYYDPEKGAALWDRYLDEWCIADDEGVEVMLNEHHQTATCVDPAAPLVLAALARMTKRARLLILGNPIANRRQPVRVAEEMAMADILARPRRSGLRARRAVGGRGRQQQSRAHERAPLGSARSHHQSLDGA
jgi:Luciferase-like monooxygenase